MTIDPTKIEAIAVLNLEVLGDNPIFPHLEDGESAHTALVRGVYALLNASDMSGAAMLQAIVAQQGNLNGEEMPLTREIDIAIFG